MRYLVTMELLETVTFDSSQQSAQHLEQRFIPNYDAYMKLEKEREILAGGALAGRRGAIFIAEAASNSVTNFHNFYY